MAGKENERLERDNHRSSSSSSSSSSRGTRGWNRKMRTCFDSLQHLVPTIPIGARLNRVELIQHVIDYIADLELILKDTQQQQQHQQQQQRHSIPPPPSPPPPPPPNCCQVHLTHRPQHGPYPPPSSPLIEATNCRTHRRPTTRRDCAPTNYPLRVIQNTVSDDDSEDGLHISKDELL